MAPYMIHHPLAALIDLCPPLPLALAIALIIDLNSPNPTRFGLESE